MATNRPDDGRMVVWLEGWQWQCCGEPWSVGSVVSWTLVAADGDELDALLPTDERVRIHRLEDHHEVLLGAEDDGWDVRLRTTGTVASIRAVRARSAPVPGGDPHVLHPVEGSARVTYVRRSHGPELAERDFQGYLVELDDSGSSRPSSAGARVSRG